jgi:hypothetical protein
MNDHKATPEQWANMADAASDGFDDGYGACLLELRARVEALEGNSKPTPNDRQIRSSLLEQVGRAAICEVNAWLRERAGGTRASWLLDNEVEQ